MRPPASKGGAELARAGNNRQIAGQDGGLGAYVCAAAAAHQAAYLWAGSDAGACAYGGVMYVARGREAPAAICRRRRCVCARASAAAPAATAAAGRALCGSTRSSPPQTPLLHAHTGVRLQQPDDARAAQRASRRVGPAARRQQLQGRAARLAGLGGRRAQRRRRRAPVRRRPAAGRRRAPRRQPAGGAPGGVQPDARPAAVPGARARRDERAPRPLLGAQALEGAPRAAAVRRRGGLHARRRGARVARQRRPQGRRRPRHPARGGPREVRMRSDFCFQHIQEQQQADCVRSSNGGGACATMHLFLQRALRCIASG